MKLAKLRHGDREAIGIVEGDHVTVLPVSAHFPTLSSLLEADDPGGEVESLRERATSEVTLPELKVADAELLAPIDHQEVWAAGVTYRRSKVARMEESESAASFYDKVYEADRPELFFKATRHRVTGPGGQVRIRRDAKWNVPEPELALVLTSRLKLVGYTVGNDMSSRDIEGENPLYLPQAKVYDGCCALGPWITLADEMPTPPEIGIQLVVHRGKEVAFTGTTSVGQMARTFDDLIGYLGRDNSFPHGTFLLTGTGVVPTDDFTLAPGDRVEISIDGIGTLASTVVQG